MPDPNPGAAWVLGARDSEADRQLVRGATDEPHGSTLTEFRKDHAARESFAIIGAQQANVPAGGYRHVVPGQVGHGLVADGEANAILAEHISRKAAGSEVLQCSLLIAK